MSTEHTFPTEVCPECGSTHLVYESQLTSCVGLAWDKHIPHTYRDSWFVYCQECLQHLPHEQQKRIQAMLFEVPDDVLLAPETKDAASRRRLIAAAPALLEACIGITALWELDSVACEWSGEIAAIEAAIAAATEGSAP